MDGFPIERPWGRLHVWRGGAGPTILAIHGLGGSGRYWQGLVDRVGASYRVVAPDLGGFGGSSRPAIAYDREFHLGNLDAAVADVSGPIVVVGHSLGGILGALWAVRHPDRVQALALVATPYPVAQGSMPTRDQHAAERDRHNPARFIYPGFQAAWPVVTFPFRSRVFSRAVVRDYMRHSLQSYWGTAQAVMWDEGSVAGIATLSEFTGPALLLSAADDKRVPMADTEQWAALLPRAEHVTAAGGHQLLLRSRFAPLATWAMQSNVRPVS